jgi:hypothetical protein
MGDNDLTINVRVPAACLAGAGVICNFVLTPQANNDVPAQVEAEPTEVRPASTDVDPDEPPSEGAEGCEQALVDTSAPAEFL